jgi:hypothetical protein
MIIRKPSEIVRLLGDWRMYVNFVEAEIETGDGTRHYGLDLTGKVSGLKFERDTVGRPHQDGVFYWVHIGPTGAPGVAAVTIDANWRYGGEIANYEQSLAAVEGFGEMHAVTFANFNLCDPLVIQTALPLILDDLDREVGATLSRESDFRSPSR